MPTMPALDSNPTETVEAAMPATDATAPRGTTRVSIIIPAYNQAQFLGSAIESALGQTGVSVEVIVVDDGSTDETPGVVARYQADARFKSVRRENGGLPSARNSGLAEATGDYICFLDSDDFYAAGKCAKQAALLDQNPEVGFVYCDFTLVDEQGVPHAEQPSIAQLQRVLSGDIFSTLAMSGYFPPHTVMIRRSLLDKIGHFDPELGGNADYDLWLRAAAVTKAVYLDEKLASYRDYGESMSKDGDHMTQTSNRTLRKIARLHPELVGDALHRLQQSSEEVFRANQHLRDNWDKALANAGQGGSVKEGDQSHALMKHLSSARMTQGRPEQKAVWDVTLDGQTCKALLLQPPAELDFEVPTGEAGVFTVQITLHPDVWEKPGAGGCEFQVQIDRRIALAMAIDPVKLVADRRWHCLRLEVPANPQGSHQIVLRTRSIGPSDFRWALWHAPRFTWTAAASAENDRLLS